MATCCVLVAYLIYKVITIHDTFEQSLAGLRKFARPRHPHHPSLHRTGSDKASAQSSHGIRIALKGLTCSACALTVSHACESLPGVAGVHVSITSSTARIFLRDDHAHTPLIHQLVAAIEDAGYGAELLPVHEPWRHQWLRVDRSTSDEADSWRRSLVVAVTGTSSLLLIDLLDAGGFPLDVFGFPSLVKLAVALISISYSTHRIYREAVRALLFGRSHSSQLASSGLLCTLCVAICHHLSASSAASRPHHDTYSLTGASLLAVILVGTRLAKLLGTRQATAFPARLAAAMPATAELRHNHSNDLSVATVAIDMLQSGDTVVVPADSPFPADGVIDQGATTVLETFITGESSPRAKKAGDKIYSGCLNVSHETTIRVTHVGNETWMGQALSTITHASADKANLESIADQILRHFSSFVILLALATGLMHSLYSSLPYTQSVIRVATVLCSACPCALGITIPVCMTAATVNASNIGVLLTSTTTQMEQLLKAKTVLLDKTGTLTEGLPTIQACYIDPVWSSDRNDSLLYHVVHTVEELSTHPVGKALRKWAGANVVREADHTDKVSLRTLEELPGLGMKAEVEADGSRLDVLVGNLRLVQPTMRDDDLHVWSQYRKTPCNCSRVYISINGCLVAQLEYHDKVRKDAATLVKDLQRRGLSVGIVTGDTAGPAKAVAKAVNIHPANVFSDLRPVEKANIIEHLQREKGPCVMIGDNVNDAPALATAAFGIALCAELSGNLAFMKYDALLMPIASSPVSAGDLWRVLQILDLAHRTVSTITKILRWSMVYNVAVLIIASGLLSPVLPFQVSLTPFRASMAMATSSVLSLTMSLNLLKWQPRARTDDARVSSV